MRVEKMIASECNQYRNAIAGSKLILPFYSTHSYARKAFLKEVTANNGTAYVLYEGKIIRAFLVFKKKEIHHFLVCDRSHFSWGQFFLMLEAFFKRTFIPQIALRLPQLLNLSLQVLFLQNGFEFSEPELITKTISYHTALVLGGGGARGAYQIGVWQALKELGISFSLVTGTSVGALNGGLIVQDDFETAKYMWEEIETQKILDFPANEFLADNLSSLTHQIGVFTAAAIQSKGVSTEPLKRLIKDTFSAKKLSQSTVNFFLVTTEIPSLKEKMIHVNQCETNLWQEWLLASASFFPAMAATKIADHYYVDGGYRNNVPIDVALNQGATECVIVDVKGPGLTKPVKIPSAVSCLTLKTPWSMGSVLLFDGVRSSQNMQLGYLETLKAFEKYSGYWYTFQAGFLQINQLSKRFRQFIESEYQLTFFHSSEKAKKICQKLRNVYKDRVYLENIGLVLIELLAKNDAISATKIYTINELVTLLKVKWEEGLGDTEEIGLISVQEWLKKYYDEYFLLSEKQQLKLLTELLNGEVEVETNVKQDNISFVMDKLPVQLLQVLFKEFIKQGVWE